MNPQRPSPLPDDLSEPFFRALARQTLLVQRCKSCATAQLAQRRCVSCSATELDWVAASGFGVLYSFAIVHTPYDAAFKDELPYNIAIVELDEGPQVYANLINLGDRKPIVGIRLQVCYDKLASGVTVPVFAPTPGVAASPNEEKVTTP